MNQEEIKIGPETASVLNDQLNEARRIIRDIVASAPACSCIDAYRLRGLTDPTCARCNGADVDEAIEWLAKVEGGE